MASKVSAMLARRPLPSPLNFDAAATAPAASAMPARLGSVALLAPGALASPSLAALAAALKSPDWALSIRRREWFEALLVMLMELTGRSVSGDLSLLMLLRDCWLRSPGESRISASWCLTGSGVECGRRRAGLSATLRSTGSLAWCHGESCAEVFLRVTGVGVVGGGDLMRSENDRLDLKLRSPDAAPDTDLPFLTSSESSGLFSVIVPSEVVGVRACFGSGVVVVLFLSIGPPKID